MNPSYDNSFGNQNADGTTSSVNLGTANAPQPMPQTSQAPASNMGMPISSGADDIVINTSANKGHKKILIICGIIISLLVAAGVILFLLFSNRDNIGGDMRSNLQTSFSSYINYVLYGEESDAQLDTSNLRSSPYFYRLEPDQISSYVEVANTKYSTFKDFYEKTEERFDTKPLQVFFQAYPTIKILEEKDLLDLYKTKGAEEAYKEIENLYDVENIQLPTNTTLDSFLENQKEITTYKLKYIIGIVENGCLTEGEKIKENCFSLDSAEQEILTQKNTANEELVLSMYRNALGAVINIYNELFDTDLNDDMDIDIETSEDVTTNDSESYLNKGSQTEEKV